MRAQTLSESRWIIAIFALLTVASWFLSVWLSVFFLLLLFCTVAFFRDPDRLAPADPNLIVAAADGTVSEIVEVDENEILKAKTRRVGIFLSIFDVHTNRAPIDGRISRAWITEGNLISGGVSGAGATLLTTVVSLDPLYLYGDADERAVLKYLKLRREGARVSARDAVIPAEMALGDETGFPHKGVMDFVDNRIDPNTGTMRARGVFSNADHGLSPGFFGRIRIPGSGKYQALLIPDRALGSDQSLKFVYVINAEKKVEFRPVTIGPMLDGLRIVKSGLKAGEQIVVEGLLRVRPGIVVDAKPWETPAQAAAK